jgi:NAD(P)-dependent dehydrogenase (short-subunit alcohol dehydrogenase family)
MVCRNEEKGRSAVKEVISASGKSCLGLACVAGDPVDQVAEEQCCGPSPWHSSPLRCAAGNQDVHLCLCDISSLESVRTLAAEHERSGTPLHVLINNAGILVSLACNQLYAGVCNTCSLLTGVSILSSAVALFCSPATAGNCQQMVLSSALRPIHWALST